MLLIFYACCLMPGEVSNKILWSITSLHGIYYEYKFLQKLRFIAVQMFLH